MAQKKWLLSVLSIAGVLAVGTVVMLLLMSNKVVAEETAVVAQGRVVKTTMLEPSSQEVRIFADGFLQSIQKTTLRSPVSGQVKAVFGGLRDGLAVRKGDVLLSLDDRRSALAFETARLDMLKSASQFATTADIPSERRQIWRDFARKLSASESHNLPGLPHGDDREELLAATLGVRGSWNSLQGAALNLNEHQIRAPFDGVISGDGMSPGSWISAGTALGTLINAQTLELPLALSIRDLPSIKVGDTVFIRRGDDENQKMGVVARIEPILDSGTQMAQVYVQIPSSDGMNWRPGTYVQAEIRGRVFDWALRLPRTCLIGGRVPLLVDGTLHLAEVDVLAFDQRDVILAANLPVDSQLVVTLLQNPIEGMALTVGGDA